MFKNPPLPQLGEIQIIEFSGQVDSIYFWIRIFLTLRKLHPNQISFNEKHVLQDHVTDTALSQNNSHGGNMEEMNKVAALKQRKQVLLTG